MSLVPRHVVLLDSITEVTGSHGGISAASYAAAVPARLYIFNDAGIGKDKAGIAALALLDAQGIAAATVAHDSARIGEAHDSWVAGAISAVNSTAALRLHLQPGQRLSAALVTLADSTR